jgi:predicted dehydrogenase
MKKAAVVGFGFMGMTHTLNILKMQNLKLTAIVDCDPSNIEKSLNARSGNIATGNITSGELDGVNIYSDFDECLKSEELEAVYICVHTSLHYGMTKKALLHDKNVFLEKPFCLDIKQAEELIELALNRKRILMVGHVVRFMSPYQKLKEWIDSSEFGELKFLSLSRFAGVPGWGQWTDKKVTNESGGALFDLVIHDIDFALYVLGLPDEIKSTVLPGTLSKHDYISALWNYRKKNVNVKIEGGNTFHINFPFQAGYMATFDKASVLYTTFRGDVIQIADNKSIKEVPAGDAGAGYYNETVYFAQCLENNVEPLECMPSSSLDSIKLCYRHI